MSVHSWCRDVQRDEAVRAAEDGRQGPLPTLEEVISRAGQFMLPEALQEPKCTERDNGLRTERVTAHKWDEAIAILHEGGSFGRGNDFHPGTIAALMIWADRGTKGLAAERDAARSERDELRTECERLRESVRVAARNRTFWHQQCALRETRAKELESRVAELESPPPVRGWLTVEERRTLSETAYVLDDRKAPAYGRFVRSLFARSSPPEVVRPKPQEAGIFSNEVRDAEWIAALAAAGVKVKEVGA